MSRPRATAPRSTFALAIAVAVALTFSVTACSSDDTKSASDTDSAKTSVSASGSGDAESAESAESDTVDIDIPTEGTPIAEVDISADGVDDPNELQKALTVLGFDTPGYVSGTTIVAQPAAGEDRQFACIAVGQLDLETYTLVVVDEDGKDLGC